MRSSDELRGAALDVLTVARCRFAASDVNTRDPAVTSAWPKRGKPAKTHA
jgi:hypothetical protein